MAEEEFLREIDELLGDKVDEGDTNNVIDAVDVKGPDDELKAALAAHEDVDVLQKLCEGRRVPMELRLDLWKECLGVSRRPDTLGTWSGPLDCDGQDIIHTQCQQAGAKLPFDEPSQQQAAKDMELVISYYCKTRNMRYSADYGWTDILLVLSSLNINKADLFNCFYAIVAKYIPRDCKSDGRPFHLFRLLMLYHDPSLCSFFDTMKLAPEVYLIPWFRNLFAATCGLEVVNVMWDLYLLERDPFLVLFLALVMILNAKELVMGSEGVSRDDVCATISSLPGQLSHDDVEDFFSLAHYYASRTPQSFRKDYHSLMFGSGRSGAALASNVSHALCLPISLQEVLDSNITDTNTEGAMKYFLVDCRPVDHFSCGHLAKSFHLDANLLLHSPTDFGVAVDRLCERVGKVGADSGEHLCFLGSGREQEDQYVNMVVAKFLQKHVRYVSLARGGFLELLIVLGGRVSQVVEDYDASKCSVFYSDSTLISSLATRTETSDSDSDSYIPAYRRRLRARGAQLYMQMASGFSERKESLRKKMGGYLWTTQAKEPEQRHVSQKDRASKRYRGAHSDVFVIADEDEELENPSVSSSEEEAGQQMVNISLFCTGPDVLYTFPATEMKEDSYTSHIVLTADSLIVLRELSDRAGWGRVKHRHKLTSILRITAKKKHPDLITFRFGSGSGDDMVISHQLRFRVPNTHKFTSAIKSRLQAMNLTPGS